MSDVEWDADDFEPVVAANPSTKTDKWVGEDEDDEVKAAWDDEDSDKKPENGEVPVIKATQVKKKKSIQERLAEKEAKRKQELEEKRKQAEQALREKNMTPEEKLAEKLRQQKIQEEADLQLAKEAFGGVEEASGDIATMDPITKEDFNRFEQILKERITKYETSAHYLPFLENLYRDLSLGLDSEDIKKLGSHLNALANEKVKVQKGAKTKKKGKQKATIFAGKDDNYDDYQEGAYDAMEDFI